MIIKVSNDVVITDYDSKILDWAKRNLEIANPDYWYAKKAGRWTGNIPQNFVLYTRRGTDLVLPYGTFPDLWSIIDRNNVEVVTDFPQPRPHGISGEIKLYDYQQVALDKMVAYKSGILEAPCGSGKTQIGLALIKHLGLKALWITHTSDLLTQSMNRAKQYYKGDFGTITAGKINIGKDITFATVQTMSQKMDLSRYKYEWDVIIVDECHKLAGTPTKLMMFYKVVSALSARYKFGLSATLHRADALIKSTFSILGHIIHTITDEDVGEKIIKARVLEVNTGIPDSIDYLNFDGIINHNKIIAYIANSDLRNNLIVSYIRGEMVQHYCLVLSHQVAHLHELRRLLGDGEIVTGEVDKNTRERIFNDARSGKVRVIFSTYALAKEGLDIPILDRLFMATPQKDLGILKQSIGRIERNVDGKQTPVVFDFIDENIAYFSKVARKRKQILNKIKITT